MGNLLSRNDLLKKDHLKILKVELGNDDYVFVKQFTAYERDLFEKSIMTPTKDEDGIVVGFEQTTEGFRSKLVVLCICDEKGNNILKAEDYLLLSENISAKKLDKIVKVAQELNGVDPIKNKEIEKNLEPDKVNSSNSDSAGN